jgi:hypothetical protein
LAELLNLGAGRIAAHKTRAAILPLNDKTDPSDFAAALKTKIADGDKALSQIPQQEGLKTVLELTAKASEDDQTAATNGAKARTTETIADIEQNETTNEATSAPLGAKERAAIGADKTSLKPLERDRLPNDGAKIEERARAVIAQLSEKSRVSGALTTQSVEDRFREIGKNGTLTELVEFANSNQLPISKVGVEISRNGAPFAAKTRLTFNSDQIARITDAAMDARAIRVSESVNKAEISAAKPNADELKTPIAVKENAQTLESSSAKKTKTIESAAPSIIGEKTPKIAIVGKPIADNAATQTSKIAEAPKINDAPKIETETKAPIGVIKDNTERSGATERSKVNVEVKPTRITKAEVKNPDQIARITDAAMDARAISRRPASQSPTARLLSLIKPIATDKQSESNRIKRNQEGQKIVEYYSIESFRARSAASLRSNFFIADAPSSESYETSAQKSVAPTFFKTTAIKPAPTESQTESAPKESVNVEAARMDTEKRAGVKISAARTAARYFASRLNEAIENYKPPITRISILMRPAELGEVEVTLVKRGEKLIVSTRSSAQTIALLSACGAELRQSLAQAGHSKVELQYRESEGDQSGKDRQERERGRRENDQKEDNGT